MVFLQAQGHAGILFDRTLRDNPLACVDQGHTDGQGESIDVQTARLTIDYLTWSGTNTQILNVDHPSVICRHSVFPSLTGTEPLHEVGLTGGEYLIFENCTFGELSHFLSW